MGAPTIPDVHGENRMGAIRSSAEIIEVAEK
jgi:hypothetical protein